MKIRGKILLFFGAIILVILILAMVVSRSTGRWGISADVINQQIALEPTDLKLELDDFQTSAIVGETINYTIKFANSGTKKALGVKIYGFLGIVNPEKTSYFERTLSGWLPSLSETAPVSNFFYYSLGDLPPGASGSLQIPIEVRRLTINQDELYSKFILAVREAQEPGFLDKLWGEQKWVEKPVVAALDIDQIVR